MKLIDKVVLGATGIGLIFLAVDHYRKQGQPQSEWSYCPYCKSYIQGPEEVFAMHIVNERRYGGGRR